MKWIVPLTFLHSRAHTLLGELIPCLALSTKRTSGFPSQPCKPRRKGAQITLKSEFESVAASANPALFSQSSSEWCFGRRMPRLLAVCRGLGWMTNPAVVMSRWWSKSCRSCGLTGKRTQPLSCKCAVLLDGAPLPSLLELEKRRCCEHRVLRQWRIFFFRSLQGRSGHVSTEFNSRFKLPHFRNILVFQH